MRAVRRGAVIGGALLGALGPVAAPAVAAWTDGASVTGTSLTTPTIATPTGFACLGLSLNMLTFTWNPVAGATSYTVRWNGGSATVAAATLTTGALLAGGTATVEANFGTWVSAPSPGKGYLVVANTAVCG